MQIIIYASTFVRLYRKSERVRVCLSVSLTFDFTFATALKRQQGRLVDDIYMTIVSDAS